ncbi:MAG: hypothetical protein NTW52_05040 [Planctomycetota bacterium]|nr:hypothetical protein [Planctomycetota bacterium]
MTNLNSQNSDLPGFLPINPSATDSQLNQSPAVNGKTRSGMWHARTSLIATASLFVTAMASVAAVAFWFGMQTASPIASTLDTSRIPPEVLRATATHGGANLAVATGRVSEEADGIFFLDYITGRLQCWVYYPRIQKFGGVFQTYVTQMLPASKNAEYLLVTGEAQPAASASNVRPGGCLVYVVDVKSGLFAAYSVPFTRAAETSGQTQNGPLNFVDGGQYRAPLPGGAVKKPSALSKEKPAADKAADANAPAAK